MCGNLPCSFRQFPDKGNFWRRADPQATISWQSQQLRVEYWSGRGHGVGPMVSSREGFQGIQVLAMVLDTWSSTLCHPALSLISTYSPGGVQIHHLCGLQVAIINWDLAENSAGPQVWPVLQPLGSQPWDPPPPPSLPLSHSLTVWTLSLLQDREALTALRTFLGEQGEWGYPGPCVGLRQELSATPGLQLRAGGFLVLAFWKIDSLQLPSGGSAPKEAWVRVPSLT